MIYGLVAGEYGVPLPLMPPIGTADFTVGLYFFDGLSVSISEFIDDQTDLIIDSEGINLVETQPVIDIIGALKDKLIAFDWTLVLEVKIDPMEDCTLFSIYSEYGYLGYSNQVYAETGGTWYFEDLNSDVGEVYGSGVPMERYIFNDDALTNGIHQIALTRTDDHISISVDGNNVQTDASNSFPLHWGESLQGIVFGGWKGSPIDGSFYLRGLAIYDAVDDLYLPALSAYSSTILPKQGAAVFAGVGSLSLDTELTNPIKQGSVLFTGSGLLSADSYVSTPLANISAEFAGAGAMSVSGFWLDGHIVYSQVLNTNGASAAGISVRSIYTISEAASQVRIKLQASSVSAMVVDHVSIGKQSSTYNTVATPVEIKFSGGASGFNISAGQTITSDWTDFAIAASDVVIIIVDYNDISTNATRYTDAAGSRYFLGATDSWNVASPGGSWGNDTRAHATYEIDVR